MRSPGAHPGPTWGCPSDPDRPFRSRSPRSADFADRPLQSALHLLHARRGGAVAAPHYLVDPRRTDADSADRRRGGHRGGAPDGRGTTAAPRLRGRRGGHRLGRAAPRDLHHHQRHRPGPAGRAPETGRPGEGERLLGHPETGSFPPAHPPQPARRRPDRDRSGGCRGTASSETERTAVAGNQRRRGTRSRGVRDGSQLRVAFHRADAPRRGAHLATGRDGDRRRDHGQAQRILHPDPAAGPWRGTRGTFPGGRRPRDRRHHRIGDCAVLRRL